MVGYLAIQALPKRGPQTTATIANDIGLSVGHVRRVLHWMVGQRTATLHRTNPNTWTV